MRGDSFRLTMPDHWAGGVVFASPHSGADYPSDLLQRSNLGDLAMRSSEDAFVDQLFATAPKLGAPLLAARFPRAYVDLNRGVDELDAALIDGVNPRVSNPRVSSGLGVIPRVVANGRAIYCGKISMMEAQERLDQVWRPYHAKLQALLDSSRAKFGEALLIDCHSMPHEALDNMAHNKRRPDIVLGDRYGASADPHMVDVVEAALAQSGLVVARNTPFAGAYTAQTYGRPSQGQHVIQIEIDRSLYMDEARLVLRPDFHVMRSAMTHMIAELVAYTRGRDAMAAE